MDAQLEKRLNELALRSAHTGATCYTRFLEPVQADTVRAVAARSGVRAAFWGGYEDAERRVAAFTAEEDAPPMEAWPLRALRLEWNARFAHPGHRDLLGAVMGLGIERETVGDIAPGRYREAECAYLFVLKDMADYIAASLESAGRASLRVSLATEAPALLPPEGETLRLTVQQERLDAVTAAAYRLSRSEAQRLISAGLVKLNHAPTLRCDAKLAAGDLISVRGHGRARVTEFQGESRRGRRVVQVFRYGK